MEPLYEQFNDIRITLIKLRCLVSDLAKFSGESSAEELRVVDEQVFVDDEADLGRALREP
jgi:hypothetical protein